MRSLRLILLVLLFLAVRPLTVRAELNEDLLTATEKGDVNEVQQLLKAGADVNTRSPDGITPLITAAIKGHAEIVTLLMKDKKLDEKQKITALIWATKWEKPEIAELLKQAGVNIDEASIDDQLFYAAFKRGIKQVLLLIKKGANVNAKDPIDKSAPLLLAVDAGNIEIVKLLLEKGADINAKDNYGTTALLCALIQQHTDITGLLMEKRADVNAQHRATGLTALLIAAEDGDKQFVSTLLDRGADVNMEDRNGYNALVRAAGEGHTDIVKLLIKKGRWKNKKESFGRALAVAVGMKRNEIAKLLIKEGADLNQRTQGWGLTCLMVAANKGNTEIAKALINNGADVNASSANGLTALYIAENQGHTEIVNLLLKAGAKK